MDHVSHGNHPTMTSSLTREETMSPIESDVSCEESYSESDQSVASSNSSSVEGSPTSTDVKPTFSDVNNRYHDNAPHAFAPSYENSSSPVHSNARRELTTAFGSQPIKQEPVSDITKLQSMVTSIDAPTTRAYHDNNAPTYTQTKANNVIKPKAVYMKPGDSLPSLSAQAGLERLGKQQPDSGVPSPTSTPAPYPAMPFPTPIPPTVPPMWYPMSMPTSPMPNAWPGAMGMPHPLLMSMGYPGFPPLPFPPMSFPAVPPQLQTTPAQNFPYTPKFEKEEDCNSPLDLSDHSRKRKTCATHDDNEDLVKPKTEPVKTMPANRKQSPCPQFDQSKVITPSPVAFPMHSLPRFGANMETTPVLPGAFPAPPKTKPMRKRRKCENNTERSTVSNSLPPFSAQQALSQPSPMLQVSPRTKSPAVSENARSSSPASLYSTPSPANNHPMPRNGSESDNTDDSGKKRKFLSSESVRVLREWYEQNLNHPYPDDALVAELSHRAGITASQVKKWMANKRVRSCNTLSFNGSIHPKKLQKLFQMQEDVNSPVSQSPVVGVQSPDVNTTPVSVTQKCRVRRNKNSRFLEPSAVQHMNKWYEEHISYPYPTDAEKKQLAELTQLTVSQVTCWFANKRNRNNNTKKASIKPDWFSATQVPFDGSNKLYDQVAFPGLYASPMLAMPPSQVLPTGVHS